ncbi:MAG: hypothetical protein ACOX5R_18870 [bacterium]|jgi:hypothetical protein
MSMIISREDLVRILGNTIVEKAEKMPEEEYEELKWAHLTEILKHFEKVAHTSLFEARRSYLLGLNTLMKVMLVRHIFESESVENL